MFFIFNTITYKLNHYEKAHHLVNTCNQYFLYYSSGPNERSYWRMGIQQWNRSASAFFEDGYFIHTIHQADKFIMSRGGSYEANNGTIKAKVYFNSSDSSNVGGELNVPFEVSADKLSMDVPDGRVNFNRVDDGKAPLAGVWRITGRMQEDGKVADIHQTGSRQTYKLLTGKKFQWVAIDPEKKEFSGTSGGSYTFKDGKYTEQIEFFSRDNSRVGVSLVFDGKLQDGKWHHSGLSSKGAKIYEVWSKVDE
ncbi:hypothetical protein [Pedobacter panaciterrae]